MKAKIAINKLGYMGKYNGLPWPRNAKDMADFKAKTTGQTVVMGRKTYESIGSKPLPNRRNIVVTSGNIDGVECVDPFLFYDWLDHDLWIIGGAMLLSLMEYKIDYIEITVIDDMTVGDTRLPDSIWLGIESGDIEAVFLEA